MATLLPPPKRVKLTHGTAQIAQKPAEPAIRNGLDGATSTQFTTEHDKETEHYARAAALLLAARERVLSAAVRNAQTIRS